MKFLLLRLSSAILKWAGILFFVYLGFLLLAVGFRFSTHLLTGISPQDFDIQRYRTPNPDPSKNFFSVLEYDFSPANKSFPYSPKGLHNFAPIPGVYGQGSQPWPWNSDFSAFFDLETTANDLRSLVKGTLPGVRPDMAEHRKFILNAKTSKETCERSISVFRPFMKKLYLGLSRQESINPYPWPSTVAPETPLFGILDLIRIAKLLSLEALLNFSELAPDFFLQPTQVNLRIAQGLLDRPIGIIQHIGGLAVTGITLPTVWKGLDGNFLNETQLGQLQEQLSTIRPTQNVPTTIRQEYCFYYHMATNDSVSFTDPETRFFSRLAKPVLTNLLQGLVVLDLWSFYKSVKENTAFLTEKPGFANPLLPSNRVISFYNDAKFREILLQLCRLDVALKLYHLRTSKLPDSLLQLTPTILNDLPLDPLTGEFFKYKKLGPTKYLVYSCWVDGIDDGGAPVEPPAVPMENPWPYYFQKLGFFRALPSQS